MSERAIAVIPARGGSKRVPRKNIRPFMDQPLIVWSIRAAQLSGCFACVIVSTDDDETAALAAAAGATVYRRPPELAHDTATTLSALQHALGLFQQESAAKVDLLALLQPTSPLRPPELIREGMARILADPGASSLQTVFPVRYFTGQIREGYWFGDFPESTRSQDLPVHYVPSGVFYVYRVADTLARNQAWGPRVLPLVQAPEDVVNIDHEDDFVRLEQVYARDPARFAHLLPTRHG
jgi:CMP-N-acetylneuraminic acid synthetase